jgi:hypothetical protein
VKPVLLLLLLASALAARTPECGVAPGFKQDGALRKFNVETLFDYINGNAEGYFLYGFVRMEGVTCTGGGVKLVFDVSEFKDEESAYGMFTGNADPRLPVVKIGAAGQVTPAKATFVKGKYYAEIAAEPQGPHAPLLEAAARAFDAKIEGSAAPPPQLDWFPREGLEPGFPRLAPQSVLGLAMLRRGYLAQYADGRAFVVTESSVDAARALFEKLKQRFPPAGEVQAGDEAYTGEYRLLGRLCLFRKGPHVGGWVNAPQGADPAARAAALAAKLP